jgi:hypothetical protein
VLFLLSSLEGFRPNKNFAGVVHSSCLATQFTAQMQGVHKCRLIWDSARGESDRFGTFSRYFKIQGSQCASEALDELPQGVVSIFLQLYTPTEHLKQLKKLLTSFRFNRFVFLHQNNTFSYVFYLLISMGNT